MKSDLLMAEIIKIVDDTLMVLSTDNDDERIHLRLGAIQELAFRRITRLMEDKND